ncbi:hypothetical protein PENNAL_c0026G07104 [Penicillium nalgiovense]|uniref:Uncharacterized protein n=1 Tax=Penicillium nalgiovense TaxID=60175 RepID=A0A1V6YBF0_PENNA|nr:hypothetical protein PENNAL_c0026G07104 [Penicillium nalgiovense]
MHTEAFRDASKTLEDHDITMAVAKVMALADVKILLDEEFAARAWVSVVDQVPDDLDHTDSYKNQNYLVSDIQKSF